MTNRQTPPSVHTSQVSLILAPQYEQDVDKHLLDSEKENVHSEIAEKKYLGAPYKPIDGMWSYIVQGQKGESRIFYMWNEGETELYLISICFISSNDDTISKDTRERCKWIMKQLFKLASIGISIGKLAKSIWDYISGSSP